MEKLTSLINLVTKSAVMVKSTVAGQIQINIQPDAFQMLNGDFGVNMILLLAVSAGALVFALHRLSKKGA